MFKKMLWHFPVPDREENMLWRAVAVYKDDISIPLLRFAKVNQQELVVRPERLLNTAAQYGNANLVRYLTDPVGEFKLTPTIYTLNAAARSGNLELVKWLLNPVMAFSLIVMNTTIECGQQSGNAELIQYLTDPAHEINQLHPISCI